MKLTHAALVMVKKLIDGGRAGAKPFGIPLEVWLVEIRKQAEGEALQPEPAAARGKEH